MIGCCSSICKREWYAIGLEQTRNLSFSGQAVQAFRNVKYKVPFFMISTRETLNKVSDTVDLPDSVS